MAKLYSEVNTFLCGRDVYLERRGSPEIQRVGIERLVYSVRPGGPDRVTLGTPDGPSYNLSIEQFRKTWRLWGSRPSDEERKGVAWET